MTQEEINELLIENARAGRIVVRLKGGDPLVFGRGGEEALCLREAGIPFEIVPGVTAGLGVTAYAGIPVTHRGAASAVAFVTGHGDPETDPARRLDWSALAQLSGYARRLHGSHSSRGDLSHAHAAGKTGDTPAAVIEAGTLPSQRTQVGTLATIAGAPRSCWFAPALLFWSSDRSSSCGTKLEWFERLPLFGQRIVDHPSARGSGSSVGPLSRRWVPKCCWRRRSK